MIENVNWLINGVGQSAEGFYKVMVVDSRTEEVVWSMPEFKRNLILNNGMNTVATTSWCNLFTYGICGTSNSPNSYDSGTDTGSVLTGTFTASGTVLTLNGGDFVAGDTIKWDTGEEVTIVTLTGAQTATVTPTSSSGTGEFTIWKTGRTALVIETKRSNTYTAVGAGNAETTRSGAVMIHRRSFDFTVETGSVTYQEVGVGWSASTSNTTFSRVKLDTAVTVEPLQKLRLVYQLQITLSPSTNVSKNLPIGGFTTNTDGAECIQAVNTSAINTTNGATISYPLQGGAVLDPGGVNSTSTGRLFFLSTSSAALAAFGSATNRVTTAYVAAAAPTNAVYVTGSHTLDVNQLFGVGEAVSASLRSVGIGWKDSVNTRLPYEAAYQAFTFLFTNVQEKTNTQTLTITIRYTWSRVLA